MTPHKKLTNQMRAVIKPLFRSTRHTNFLLDTKRGKVQHFSNQYIAILLLLPLLQGCAARDNQRRKTVTQIRIYSRTGVLMQDSKVQKGTFYLHDLDLMKGTNVHYSWVDEGGVSHHLPAGSWFYVEELK